MPNEKKSEPGPWKFRFLDATRVVGFLGGILVLLAAVGSYFVNQEYIRQNARAIRELTESLETLTDSHFEFRIREAGRTERLKGIERDITRCCRGRREPTP